MIAEVLSVGTELLLGQTIDTNAAALSKTLSALGINLYYRATVGDNPGRLREALEAAFSRADVVITIGGLGPTMDDLTKETVCSVLGVETAVNADQDARLHEIAERRGFNVPPSFYKQAVLPVDGQGKAVPNPNGTAPGVWAEKNGKIAVCLPGPPNEFLPMVEQSVAPWLAERMGGARTVIKSQTLRIIGVGESVAEDTVKDLMNSDNPTVAPYAKLGECHLRVTARAESDEAALAIIAPVEAEIRRRLGDAVYGINSETLEYACVQLLKQSRAHVATAESCTGGLVAQRITSISGSSEVFNMGFVTYSNQAKQQLVGVPADLIIQQGAVSEEVARAMAEGARRVAGAEYGVGITGIAGPGGGTDEKPVGLVYIAVAAPAQTLVARQQFPGARDTVRQRSAQFALAMLRDALLAASRGTETKSPSRTV